MKEALVVIMIAFIACFAVMAYYGRKALLTGKIFGDDDER